MPAISYRDIFWSDTPDSWDSIKFGDIVSQQKRTVEDAESDAAAVCSVTNERGFVLSDDYFEKKVYSKDISDYKLVESGEFAYNPSRIDVGSIAQLEGFDEAAISPMYEVFSIDEERILPEYMRLLTNAPKIVSLFEAFSQGSVRETLNFSQFAEIPLSLPPIQQQSEIVSKQSYISDAISETEIILSRLESIYIGLSRELFPKMDDESNGTVLSESNDWSLRELDTVGRMSRGKFTHRPRNDPQMYGGEHPFIQTGAVASARGELTEYTQTLNNRGTEVSKRFEKGTVLITIAGNVGDTAITSFPVYFPDSVVGIETNEGVDNRYLEHALRRYSDELAGSSTESTQKNLNLSILSDFELPIPSLSRQKRIAKNLSYIDTLHSIETENLDNLSKISEEVTNQFISGN
jgi:type I restriction enzyme S subunit